MGIVVFWLEREILPAPHSVPFKETELLSALSFAETLRKQGKKHVIISTELSDSVGAPGVSSVENGKTPNGEEYTWSKQHRGSQ